MTGAQRSEVGGAPASRPTARAAGLAARLRFAALAVALAAVAGGAQAQVGLRPFAVTITEAPAPATPAAGAASSGSPAARTVDTPVTGLVWYPTAAPSTPQRLGPFAFDAALGAPPSAGRFPLAIVSHGTGGHELGHAWIAAGLVRAGWIVVALRHPGDNYEDRSAVGRADFFERRPRQASAVLSAVLADPAWAGRVDPARIAVVGHSAGGHVALAMAGGDPARARVVAHCAPGGPGPRDDAAMCALGGRRAPEASAAMADGPGADGVRVRDARIRAAVALAPLGVALAPASLASIDEPVMIDHGARDEVLAPSLHGAMLCATISRAECRLDPAAGHFAAFQAGTGPLPGAAGDPAIDPPGFDRAGWQAAALPRIVGFLERSTR